MKINRTLTKLAVTSVMSVCAVTLVLTLHGKIAVAGEGFSAFRHVAEPVASAADPWGPVQTPMLSLINAAPLLLPYVNNAPSFGVPGTVVGNFWERTQVTGDWGGIRTDLARRGMFIDIFTTTTYQNVTSGGIKTDDAIWNNTQMSFNIDTGRAGLWPGGLLHVTVQARHGNSPEDTFTVGSYVPQHYGLLLPGPHFANDIYPSDYYIAQAFSRRFSVIGGVISGLFLPDQTLFGNSYRYAFTNFNLNKNPFFANFYGPTALAALGVWAPAEWLVIEGGVLDPDTTADFSNAPFDKVNLYLQAIATYSIAGLPGQFSVAGNWTNKPKLNLAAPFGPLSPEQIADLIEGFSTGRLAINFEDESWFVIANFSQYLYVMEDPGAIRPKLKSGQPLRGIGVFGRLGYAPEKTNPVARHASIALYGYGLLNARKYDSFGAGFYYNGISNDLQKTVEQLTANALTIENESGMEVFYDFAITPAIRLIPSYQHIWNPLLAQVESRQKHADVFLVRVNIAW
jgi:hypothetical protein